MDISKLREPLSISDIDFRVQSINNGGFATILAYKDARVDMNRLDDAVGALNWKREHSNSNANCIVSVYNEKTSQWVSKEDTGSESNTEAKKGQASDSFKRACFNWGIGRELYNYPIISIKLNPNEITDKNGKKYASWDFKLKEWKWISQFVDGELTFLAAKDTNDVIRFKFGVYNKGLESTEGLASGAPEPSVVDDAKVEDEPKAVEAKIDEDANIEGFLKKKAESISSPASDEAIDEDQEERDSLIAQHKDLFGKNPSSQMKIESLRTKVEEGLIKQVEMAKVAEKAVEAIEKPVEEVVEKVVEEAPVEPDPIKEEEEVDLGMYGGDMIDDANKITEFTDKEAFKNWAVTTFKKWEGVADEAHIAEFKEACNKQFEKLG